MITDGCHNPNCRCRESHSGLPLELREKALTLVRLGCTDAETIFDLFSPLGENIRPGGRFITDAHREECLQQFFTHRDVSRFLANYCSGGNGPLRILDACTGVGHLSWHLRQHQVIGLEVDPDAAEVGNHLLGPAFGGHPDSKIVLNDFQYHRWEGEFDLVLGNPPFSLRIRDRRDLWDLHGWARWAKAEIFWWQQAIHAVRPGGLVAAILPASARRGNTTYQDFWDRGETEAGSLKWLVARYVEPLVWISLPGDVERGTCWPVSLSIYRRHPEVRRPHTGATPPNDFPIECCFDLHRTSHLFAAMGETGSGMASRLRGTMEKLLEGPLTTVFPDTIEPPEPWAPAEEKDEEFVADLPDGLDLTGGGYDALITNGRLRLKPTSFEAAAELAMERLLRGSHRDRKTEVVTWHLDQVLSGPVASAMETAKGLAADFGGTVYLSEQNSRTLAGHARWMERQTAPFRRWAYRGCRERDGDVRQTLIPDHGEWKPQYETPPLVGTMGPAGGRVRKVTRFANCRFHELFSGLGIVEKGKHYWQLRAIPAVLVTECLCDFCKVSGGRWELLHGEDGPEAALPANIHEWDRRARALGFHEVLYRFAYRDLLQAAIKQNVLVAFQMGLAKTRFSICLCRLWGSERVLLVVPKKIHKEWKDELCKLVSLCQRMGRPDLAAEFRDWQVIESGAQIMDREQHRAWKQAKARGEDVSEMDDGIRLRRWNLIANNLLWTIPKDWREPCTCCKGTGRLAGKKCKWCQGHGKPRAEYRRPLCSSCHGKGGRETTKDSDYDSRLGVTVRFNPVPGKPGVYWRVCPTCRGRGEKPSEDGVERKPRLGLKRAFAHYLVRLCPSVVVDEAYSLQDPTSNQSKGVYALRPKHTVSLTGTPVRGFPNNVLGLLNFTFGAGSNVFPDYSYWEEGAVKRFLDRFGTYLMYSEEHGATGSKGKKKLLPKIRDVEGFQEMLQGLMIRRVRTEPEVQEEVPFPVPLLDDFKVGMDDLHHQFYEALIREFEAWYESRMAESDDYDGKGVSEMEIRGKLTFLAMAASCPQAMALEGMVTPEDAEDADYEAIGLNPREEHDLATVRGTFVRMARHLRSEIFTRQTSDGVRLFGQALQSRQKRLSAAVTAFHRLAGQQNAKGILDADPDERGSFLAKAKEVGTEYLTSKQQAAVDQVLEALERGCRSGVGYKVMLASKYRHSATFMYRALQDRGVSCVYIDGSVSLASRKTKRDSPREARIRQFHDEDGTDVLVATTVALAEGLNLPRVYEVIFLDYDWVPSVMAQFFSRMLRPHVECPGCSEMVVPTPATDCPHCGDYAWVVGSDRGAGLACGLCGVDLPARMELGEGQHRPVLHVNDHTADNLCPHCDVSLEGVLGLQKRVSFLSSRGTLDDYMELVVRLKEASIGEGLDFEDFDPVLLANLPDVRQYANGIMDGTADETLERFKRRYRVVGGEELAEEEE